MNKLVHQQDGSVSSIDRWTVDLFGLLISLLAGLYSLFMARYPTFDETVLYNAVYTELHTGQMTYPAHGDFDGMVIHPPLHYLEIAWLMRLGFGFFHAAGVLILIPLGLCLWLIRAGRFPAIVKLALMAGLFMTIFIWAPVQGGRPDLNLTLSWFAGLLALESARLDSWKTWKLGLGGFLLTYASGVHYPGIVACTGIVIYAVRLWRSLKFSAAKPKLLALITGGLLFGIPYLLLFVVPNWEDIRAMTKAVQGSGGITEAFNRHLAAYQFLSLQLENSWVFRPIVSTLSLPILKLGIPAIVVAPFLWFFHPAIRGIALAGLPLPLFILLGSQAKSIVYTGYYIPEILLYLTGLILLFTTLLTWVIGRVFGDRHRYLPILLVCLFTVACIVDIPNTLANKFSLNIDNSALPPGKVAADAVKMYLTAERGSKHQFRLQHLDLEIARASAKEMVGETALVGTSSATVWYTGGAKKLAFVTSELLYPADVSKVDLKQYFSSFDALVQDSHQSWVTWNKQRSTLLSWYGDRTLQLKGFFFGDPRVEREYGQSYLSYLLFNTKPTKPLTGYGFVDQKLYRFEENPSGDQVFTVAICPVNTLNNQQLNLDLFNTWYLPGKTNQLPTEKVANAFVMPRDQYQTVQSLIATQCQIRDQHFGVIQMIDSNLLLNKLKNRDTTIQFYPTLTAAIAARTSKPS
jgi:hypothetical protein